MGRGNDKRAWGKTNESAACKKRLQLFLILSIPISCPNSEPPGGFGEVFPVFYANFWLQTAQSFCNIQIIAQEELPVTSETRVNKKSLFLEDTTTTWAIILINCQRTIIHLKATQYCTEAHRHASFISWYTVSAGSEQPNPLTFPVGFGTIQNQETWYQPTLLYCANWLGSHNADKTAQRQQAEDQSNIINCKLSSDLFSGRMLAC